MDNTRKRKADDASENCSFGDSLKEECHKNFKPEIKCFLSFSEQEQVVFKWRAGLIVSDLSIKTICHYHKYKFRDSFKKQFTKCCNVYGKHSKKVKGGHPVTLDMAMQLKNENKDVVP